MRRSRPRCRASCARWCAWARGRAAAARDGRPAAQSAALGRPLQVRRTCSICRGLRGIVDYEPEELVLTARRRHAARARSRRALAERKQMLAFEPPDLRRAARRRRTSGRPSAACSPATSPAPAGIKAGRRARPSARLQRRERPRRVFKSGGKVVKNVTGYDLSQADRGLLRHARRADRESRSRSCRAPRRGNTVLMLGARRTAPRSVR